MSEETEVPETIEVDGIDTLKALGAPAEILKSVTALMMDGKHVTASVSTGSPASVAILVDGVVAATFHKTVSMETEVSGNDAIKEDPRLEHAPTSQVNNNIVSTFIGRQQLVQLLLARGIKIPKPTRAPTDEEMQTGAFDSSEVVPDEGGLGCEIYFKGEPFDGVLEVRYPEA